MHIEPDDAGIAAEPGHLALGELLDGVAQFFDHLLVADLPGQVPGQVFVFQAELDHEFFADTLVQKGADFIHHALLQALFKPLVDPLLQDFPGPGDAELEQGITRGFGAGSGIPGGQLFQQAHDTVAVFRIHVGIGQLFLQHLIELRGGIGFQLGPEGQVRRLVGEDVAVGHGIHIEPGAADEEGHIPAGNDAVDGFIGEALEIRHGEEFPGPAHVQEMMGDTLHLFRGDLAGTEVQALIDLAGIGGDDFPVEAGGQLHAQGAFA